MFVHNLQVVYFYRLSEFLATVVSRLLSLGCGHDSCGAWFMFCVFDVRFPYFLDKIVLS